MDKKRENDFTINLAKSLIELHQWSPSEILDLPGWELMHTSAILEELSEVLRKLNEIEALKQLPPEPFDNESDYQKHCQNVLKNNPFYIVYYIPQEDDRSSIETLIM